MPLSRLLLIQTSKSSLMKNKAIFDRTVAERKEKEI